MHRQSAPCSVSGVLVRTLPADLADVAVRLSALPGVDAHHQEMSTGRLVITLDGADTGDERDALERVRRETGVISAELVYHFVAPPDEDAPSDAPRPGRS